MLDEGFFDHTDPAGRTPTDRATRSGYTCADRPLGSNSFTDGSIGENILQTHHFRQYSTTTRNGVSFREYDWKTPEELAREIISLWSASPGHRANLLLAQYVHEGLGMALADDRRLFVTQNFC
jgi:uncharacterized protein YkwD